MMLVPRTSDKESKLREAQKAIYFMSLCLQTTKDFDTKINEDLEEQMKSLLER